MRIVAGVLCVAVSGCSFGMKSVDPKWDGATEPECSDSPLAPIGDGVVAGVALGFGAVGVDHDNGTLAIPGLLIGLGFAISSIVGESTWNACKEAKAQWRVGGAIGRASNANGRRGDDEAVEKPLDPPKPATLRGYFCSSSPSNIAVGFCVREKAECERTRDVSVATLPDFSDCTLVETAWCTGDLCFPGKESCDARRARSQIEAECIESK